MLPTIDLEKVKEGDAESFRQFYILFYPKLKAFACRFVDEPTSHDLVQEVFASFFEKKSTLQINNIQSYLFKWTQNRCLNYLRDRMTAKEYESRLVIAEARIAFLEKNMDTNDVLKHVFSNDLRDFINASIDKLPPKCAQVFRYCYWDELKHEEIAGIMGISPRTVEAHIRQAITFLRKDLKDLLLLLFMFIDVK